MLNDKRLNTKAAMCLQAVSWFIQSWGLVEKKNVLWQKIYLKYANIDTPIENTHGSIQLS